MPNPEDVTQPKQNVSEETVNDLLLKNWWNDFEGHLGVDRVQFSLFLCDSGMVCGNYCYYKNQVKVALVGKITGRNLLLIEFNQGKPTGYFNGKVTDSSKVEGFSEDMLHQQKQAFKISMESACYGSSTHRYQSMKGTDSEVEAFMAHVKGAFLSDEKEWICNHVDYPIYITLHKRLTEFTNKQQLLARFNEISTSAFKNRIRNCYTTNLFYREEGTMLGNGSIWIKNGLGLNKYCISQINL